MVMLRSLTSLVDLQIVVLEQALHAVRQQLHAQSSADIAQTIGEVSRLVHALMRRMAKKGSSQQVPPGVGKAGHFSLFAPRGRPKFSARGFHEPDFDVSRSLSSSSGSLFFRHWVEGRRALTCVENAFRKIAHQTLAWAFRRWYESVMDVSDEDVAIYRDRRRRTSMTSMREERVYEEEDHRDSYATPSEFEHSDHDSVAHYGPQIFSADGEHISLDYDSSPDKPSKNRLLFANQMQREKLWFHLEESPNLNHASSFEQAGSSSYPGQSDSQPEYKASQEYGYFTEQTRLDDNAISRYRDEYNEAIFTPSHSVAGSYGSSSFAVRREDHQSNMEEMYDGIELPP